MIAQISTEQEQRQAVVAAAKGWLGTPYHTHGRVKGAGVDCGMLLLEVFREAGVLPELDPGYYPADWHLHQTSELYRGWVERYARPLSPGENPLPGDIALFRFGKTVSHGAVVAEWPVVIHSYIREGVVYADATNGPLQNTFEGCWRMRGWV